MNDYKNQTLYPDAMARSIDGRTINGVKRQYKAMMQHADTQDIGLYLQRRPSRVEICKIFHKAEWTAATDAQVTTALDQLIPKVSLDEWPDAVVRMCFTRFTGSLAGESSDTASLKRLIEQTDPWLQFPFNMKRPCVCSYPGLPMSGKIATYTKLL